MLKKLLASTALAIALAASVTIIVAADKALSHDGLSTMHTELLNPTVRVTAVMQSGVARGSGTVVHSGEDGVYILTNHHVVDGLLKEHVDGQPAVQVQIENWAFLPGRDTALPIATRATIASDDEADDLTLLRVSDPEFRAERVANVISPADHVEMGEPVFAVGGGLGDRPFVTNGLVSLTNIFGHGGLDGHTLISAPIISGNSGGGAYVLRAGTYEFIGVPSALEVAHDNPITHMGLVIPMRVVRPFLVQAGLHEYADHRSGHSARALMAAVL
jgi:S1-C subfamily serine protease